MQGYDFLFSDDSIEEATRLTWEFKSKGFNVNGTSAFSGIIENDLDTFLDESEDELDMADIGWEAFEDAFANRLFSVKRRLSNQIFRFLHKQPKL